MLGCTRVVQMPESWCIFVRILLECSRMRCCTWAAGVERHVVQSHLYFLLLFSMIFQIGIFCIPFSYVPSLQKNSVAQFKGRFYDNKVATYCQVAVVCHQQSQAQWWGVGRIEAGRACLHHVKIAVGVGATQTGVCKKSYQVPDVTYIFSKWFWAAEYLLQVETRENSNPCTFQLDRQLKMEGEWVGTCLWSDPFIHSPCSQHSSLFPCNFC